MKGCTKFDLKKTQTLIDSKISNMYQMYTKYIPKKRGTKHITRDLVVLLLTTCYLLLTVKPVQAITDPLAVPNNKFGIHIISATPDEIMPASDLVNTNGDWGYVTVVIESKDRNEQKWQEVFDKFRRGHLIPIVRLATQPENGGFWKRPYEGEEQAWADFLDKLNWPIKNRYVVIYNEPNHATEWGGTVDPADYAKVLDLHITALKNKNDDFFVMNAGLDASAPSKQPQYQDEFSFIKEMNNAVPEIFDRLDGWSSHSYPNPGFVGSPDDSGKGSVRTWFWEQQVLRDLGKLKKLPIFITETGWKHSEGIQTNTSYSSPEAVAEFYKKAFNSAWSSSQIIAVTPFLLSYQQPPFDHFSFKKITGQRQQNLEYYAHYAALLNTKKVTGRPVQENKATLDKGAVYTSIVAGETYNISITVKNSGQSIWNEYDQVKLVPTKGGKQLGMADAAIPLSEKIEPGQEHTFIVTLKAPEAGTFPTAFNLFSGNREFDTAGWEFTTEVKSPVIIQISAKLQWKDNAAGQYVLDIVGAFSEAVNKTPLSVILSRSGTSEQLEERFLIPDTTYDFTLRKPYYKPKTIRTTVKTGLNALDFDQLQPDIGSAILKPKELWKLLPLSN